MNRLKIEFLSFAWYLVQFRTFQAENGPCNILDLIQFDPRFFRFFVGRVWSFFKGTPLGFQAVSRSGRSWSSSKATRGAGGGGEMRPVWDDDLMAEADQQPRQPYFSIGTPHDSKLSRSVR